MENNTGRERRFNGIKGMYREYKPYIPIIVIPLILIVGMYALMVFTGNENIKSKDEMYGGTGELVEVSENKEKELVVKEVILWERRVQVTGEEGEEILLSKYNFEEFNPEVGGTIGYKKKEYTNELLNKEYMSENVSEIINIKIP